MDFELETNILQGIWAALQVIKLLPEFPCRKPCYYISWYMTAIAGFVEDNSMSRSHDSIRPIQV